ncbi:hypothetical protein DI383_03250 [Flavobacteriaceae bacterium LYZ1037]|nr:hypothetical protein DI383_03250 [Flavobacteriaceae bacterium LYZ1037]
MSGDIFLNVSKNKSGLLSCNNLISFVKVFFKSLLNFLSVLAFRFCICFGDKFSFYKIGKTKLGDV